MIPDSPFYEDCFHALQQSPLCKGLNRSILEDMMPLFTRRTWSKGMQFSEEQNSKFFHIVLSGRLELTRVHPESGRQITLYLLRPGDGYDILTLLDGQAHDLLPVVLDNVETLTTGLDTARQWIASHPEFNRCFLPYLGEQMRQLENLSTDLALHDTATRLARLILHYVDVKMGALVVGKYPVPLIHDFSHDTLACMVGSVRTVVNRHLQQLKKDGVVEFQRGHLAVKNLEMLALKAGKHLHQLQHKEK